MRRKIVVMMTAFVLSLFLYNNVNAMPARPGMEESLTGRHGDNGGCISKPGKLVKADQLPDKRTTGKKRKNAGREESKKALPLLIIVAEFSNVSYSNNYDWAGAIFSGDRSLNDYYNDMSLGQFEFTPVTESSCYGTDDNRNKADRENDGIIHVTLDSAHQIWTFQTYSTAAKKEDASFFRALGQILKKADPYIDFSEYDTDGDGRIENNEMALGFVIAGYEASAVEYYSKGEELYLWAHANTDVDDQMGYLSRAGYSVSYPRPDGMGLYNYIAMAERTELESSATQSGIGTLAHELGHYLGLPDLYSTSASDGSWSSYQVGNLSIMADGSWGVDEEGNLQPYSMDPWCRMMLGWLKPQEAGCCGHYTVTGESLDSSAGQTEREAAARVLKIPLAGRNDYYLVENRSFDKWDKTLKTYYGYDDCNGIVVWHIDQTVIDRYFDSNTVNDYNHRPGIVPLYEEEASGKLSFLGSLSDRASAGRVCPFFSKERWENRYLDTLGGRLFLPVYGSGTSSSDRLSARTLSDTGIRFLSNPASSMDVSVHFHLTEKEGKEAACTEEGWVSHWTCSECGNDYGDSSAEEALTQDSLYIAAKGHDPQVTIEAEEAGCTKAGRTAEVKCQVCGEVLQESSVIPATGHVAASALRENVIAATSDHEGSYEDVVYCQTCGQEMSRTKKILPAQGKQEEGTTASQKSQGRTKSPDRSFGTLKLAAKKAGKGSVSLTYNKVKGASSYVIYGCPCETKGKTWPFKKLKTLKGNTFTHKKLKKGTYYKYKVAACKKEGGKQTVLAWSKLIHVTTTGGRYGNYLAVPVNKKTLKLKKGKTFTIKANCRVSPGKKKVQKHRGLCYESSNTKVASVSKKGKVTARQKGSCSVYVYTQSGNWTKITVKVE